MRHRHIAAFLLTGCAAFLASMEPPAAAEAPPVRAKLLTQRIDLRPDGLATRTYHDEFQPLNAAGVQRFGQYPIRYSELMEDLEILEAYTLKPDGQKLPVNVAAILSQQAPGVPNVPLYSDQKQKVILFRDVQPGDTLVVDYRKTQKEAYIPGHFADTFVYNPTPQLPVDQIRIELASPRSLPLSLDARDVTVRETTEGDQVLRSWGFSATATSPEGAAVAPFDRHPRVAVTTFANYDAFAAAYAAQAAPKIAVTPEIQALADQLTTGTTARREQVQKLYEYVSGRVRYVGLELGRSAIIPHDAHLVLTNGYGDCKDKAVLLAALLKAKGIAGELVVLNATNAYTVAPIATLDPFNHVILYVPEFDLYADTTPSVVPFGLLPLELYGKPVVHAVSNGNARRQIPIAPSMSVALKTVQKLSDDGRVVGNTSATATGPLGVLLRMQARGIQGAGPERFSADSLRMLGSPTGRVTANMSPPEALAADYTVNVDFDTSGPPRALQGEGFVLGPRMALAPRPGNVLFGQIGARTVPATEPTPCFTGTSSEETTLEIPAHRQVASLPAETAYTSPHVRYTAKWSMEGNSITVRREFTTMIDAPLCTDEVRREAVNAHDKIRQEQATQIRLVPR